MRLNISVVRFNVKPFSSGGVTSGKYTVTSSALPFSTGLIGFPFISDMKFEDNTIKLVGSVRPISRLLTSFRSSTVNSINTSVSDILLCKYPPVKVYESFIEVTSSPDWRVIASYWMLDTLTVSVKVKLM